MKKRVGIKRAVALVLSVTALCALLCVQAGAATLSDIKGHWAETAIRAGVSAGYINGYTDGTFRPNNPVSRWEFCKMLNQALGLKNTVSISFSDVKSSHTGYGELQKSLSAGYIAGYTDGTFRPNQTITRQEAALMLSRVVTRPTTVKSSQSFADSASIGDWSREGVDMITTKGYMTGESGNKFNPNRKMTRADVAQVIYNLLQGETVVSDANAQISSAVTRSNTLFVNNVTINPEVDAGAVTFRSCRILGALMVNGGSMVTLYDTGVNYLSAACEDVAIYTTGNAEVKQTVVKAGVTLAESSLSGDGFENVTLNGTGLASSTVKLTGTFDKVDVQNSAVISHGTGKITAMTISKKTNTVLQKGTIGTLTVSEAAAGSTVSMAQGVTVDTANINGQAAFYGEGIINRAVETVNGVTYETQPVRIINEADSDDEGILQPTMVPARGSGSVDTDSTVSLVFDEAIYTTSGTSVTSSYIENSVVELRRYSQTGTKIPFSAYVSGRTVTITPDASLEAGSTYYVIVKADSLKNGAGQRNTAYTSYFTTKSTPSATLQPTVSPANGSTGVAISAAVTLSFDDVLFNASGNTLTTSYVEGSVVELRRGSATGALVSYTASISTDKRTITLYPDEDLSTNSTYYVVVAAGKLKNADGATNPKTTYSFTTGTSTTLTPTVSPTNGRTSVSKTTSITLTFDEPVYEDIGVTLTAAYIRSSVVELRKGSVTGESVAFTASVSSNKRSITIQPTVALADNTTYYVVVNKGTLVNENGSANGRFVSKFSTGSVIETDIEVAPADKATGVGTGESITLTFGAPVYRAGYTSLKASYVESTAVELRRGSTSGTRVDFTATVAEDGKTLTIKPYNELEQNTRYYVVIPTGTLEYSDGSTVSAFSSYFTTADANPLTILLDSDGVSSTSAAFAVRSAVEGKLTVTYSGEGRTTTLVSGITARAGEDRSFELTDLKAGYSYTIYTTLVYNGLTYTKSQSFTTTTSSVTSTIKEMRLVAGADEYSLIEAAGSSTSFTVYPTAYTGAKLVLLPTEDSVSAVEYKAGTSTSTPYTTLAAGSGGYYTIPNLTFAKGETMTLQIKVTAENTSYSRIYTVKIICNY